MKPAIFPLSQRARALRPARLGLLVVALAAASAFVARAGRAQSDDTPPLPVTVLVEPVREASEVRGAVARALVRRRYVIESESGDRITAHYSHGEAFLRIAVAYQGDRAVVQLVESRAVERERYDGWMRGLQATIHDELRAPPPPARVAPRGPEPVTVVVEPARDLAAVRQAISRALVRRRYLVESDDGQRIVARYRHGDAFLRIAVTYQADRAVIQLVERKDVELERYEGWMQKLQRTIQVELDESAP